MFSEKFEKAEIAEDDSGKYESRHEEARRFENPPRFRREQAGENMIQADENKHGLKRGEQKALEYGADFDDKDRLDAERIDDDHVGNKKEGNEQPELCAP